MSLPPSSPRLPSPPPPTEIQIGPKSPSLGSSNSQDFTVEQSIIDANAKRRIHPGTKSADMAAGPPLIPLNELDSAFQLQEHLKALHYHYTRSASEPSSTTPITRETAILLATQPEGVDRALWLYELCRFLINKCNDLIVGFLFDSPPCSATTCPEMRASEWQFLCAVHESPKSCCAIDYCCHTLDWATNIVTSQKIFPSRLSLGAGDAVDERGAGVKHLTNIFRRLHRIFAHAWFQHRGVFWMVEGQTGLYVLFKTVCDTYDLLPAENYKLPPEAEGLEPNEDSRHVQSILKPTASNTLAVEDDLLNVGRNTRRHIRQSPSVGSAVTTVPEADEDEGDVSQKLEHLQLTDEETEADVPVIVETLEIEEPEVEKVPEVEILSDESSWNEISSESVEGHIEPPKLEEIIPEKEPEANEEAHAETEEVPKEAPKEDPKEVSKEAPKEEPEEEVGKEAEKAQEETHLESEEKKEEEA